MEMQAPLFSFQFWHTRIGSVDHVYSLQGSASWDQSAAHFFPSECNSKLDAETIDRSIDYYRGWVHSSYTQPERRCTQAMNALSSRLLLVRVRLSLSCPPGRQAGTIPTTSITDHVSKRKRRPSSSGSGGCTTDENPHSVAQLCHPPHPAIIRRAENHNFFSIRTSHFSCAVKYKDQFSQPTCYGLWKLSASV